jgi:hypothetical protein
VISVVNGYVCTNCADAAKAKRGEDPHPSPAKEAQDAAKADGLDKPSRLGDPAVVFGGALAGVQPVNDGSAPGIVPKTPTSPQVSAQKVDFFA